MRENIKCVILGDRLVGKTSMVRTYCQDWEGVNQSWNGRIPPINDGVSAWETEVDGIQVTLGLWDISYNGHTDYERLRPLSYPLTDIFMVCFSLAQPESYESVYSKWVPELFSFVPIPQFYWLALNVTCEEIEMVKEVLFHSH